MTQRTTGQEVTASMILQALTYTSACFNLNLPMFMCVLFVLHRAIFKVSQLLISTDIKHKHGFFLLLANPILDKVSCFLFQVLASSSFFFFGGEFSSCVVIRSAKAIWWCSSLFISQDSWTHTTLIPASYIVICGKCRWIWGLFIYHLASFITNKKICWFVIFFLQTSDTHAKMIETLKSSGFVTQEFILSPLQFGVPYSRPRYFCLVLVLSLPLLSVLQTTLTFFEIKFYELDSLYVMADTTDEFQDVDSWVLDQICWANYCLFLLKILIYS